MWRAAYASDACAQLVRACMYDVRTVARGRVYHVDVVHCVVLRMPLMRARGCAYTRANYHALRASGARGAMSAPGAILTRAHV